MDPSSTHPSSVDDMATVPNMNEMNQNILTADPFGFPMTTGNEFENVDTSEFDSLFPGGPSYDKFEPYDPTTANLGPSSSTTATMNVSGAQASTGNTKPKANSKNKPTTAMKKEPKGKAKAKVNSAAAAAAAAAAGDGDEQGDLLHEEVEEHSDQIAQACYALANSVDLGSSKPGGIDQNKFMDELAGMVLYSGDVDEQITSRMKPSQWNRPVDKGKFDTFAKDMTGGAWVGSNSNLVTLVADADPNNQTLWVIDGQHRVLALQKAITEISKPAVEFGLTYRVLPGSCHLSRKFCERVVSISASTTNSVPLNYGDRLGFFLGLSTSFTAAENLRKRDIKRAGQQEKGSASEKMKAWRERRFAHFKRVIPSLDSMRELEVRLKRGT